MNIREQITSLELSMKLKDLGVSQESTWYWYCDEERDDTPVVNLDDETKHVKYNGGVGYYDHKYAAFTAEELGAHLPWDILSGPERGRLVLEKSPMNKPWKATYISSGGRLAYSNQSDSIVDSMAQLLIYVIENKLTTTDMSVKSLRPSQPDVKKTEKQP